MTTTATTRAMTRPDEWRDMHGILLLDKPLGLSSNQALQRARRMLRARKGGHTGSLDPLASGMLPLCFGDATKVSQLLLEADKTYQVRAVLGERRSTGDLEGEIVERADVPSRSLDAWRRIAAGFVGETEQVPPMYSALKHDGRRLYSLARAGVEVERPARRIRISSLEVTGMSGATLDMTVTCSKGTYIRALIEDLAAAGGTVAHTAMLRRTGVEPFRDRMVTLDEIESAVSQGRADTLILGADAALVEWPAVYLPAAEAARFCEGQRLPGIAAECTGDHRVYGATDVFLGIGSVGEDRVLRPGRVFPSAAEALAARSQHAPG